MSDAEEKVALYQAEVDGVAYTPNLILTLILIMV